MTEKRDPLTNDLIFRLRQAKLWVGGRLHTAAAEALEAKDAEIAVLLADAERMDWLKNKLMAYDFAEHAILIKWPKGVDFKFGDLRGSIDAARKIEEPLAHVVKLQDENERLRVDAERHDNHLFKMGWISAASWAKRPDLIADIESPAYLSDRHEAMGTT